MWCQQMEICVTVNSAWTSKKVVVVRNVLYEIHSEFTKGTRFVQPANYIALELKSSYIGLNIYSTYRDSTKVSDEFKLFKIKVQAFKALNSNFFKARNSSILATNSVPIKRFQTPKVLFSLKSLNFKLDFITNQSFV